MEYAVRAIFSLLDKAIYSVVETLMQLIIDLANLQLFSNSTITEFANRIYIILGLVMFFKITISFIQILINPDKMNDKEQGLGNILKRVAISMILIVFVPSIFRLARQVQSYVIPIIPRVLLGVTVDPNQDDPNTQERMNATARMMAFYSFYHFLLMIMNHVIMAKF